MSREKMLAILRRQPRTDDGVPIVLHENIYVIRKGRVRVCGYIKVWLDEESGNALVGRVRDGSGNEWTVYCDEAYSTSDLAKAELERQRSEDAGFAAALATPTARQP